MGQTSEKGHKHNHHGHEHGNHGHHVNILSAKDGKLSGVFYWAIGLNLAYVVIEALFGFINGSMGLLSDAGHNLSDVASLFIALIAFKAAQRPSNPNYSYGYGKATIEASFINAVILYVAVIFIVYESIERLMKPAAVDGIEIAWVAGIGVIINGITAWMLMRHSQNDLNVKGAFLHMAADTLVSVGVAVSGILIHYTNWNWLDPVVGLIIAFMIAIGSWSLLRQSLKLALDGVPDNVDVDKIQQTILSVENVKSLHHLHVWALSTTKNALTVHVLVDRPEHIDTVIESIRRDLKEIGISHSTIEAETVHHDCGHSGFDPQKEI